MEIQKNIKCRAITDVLVRFALVVYLLYIVARSAQKLSVAPIGSSESYLNTESNSTPALAFTFCLETAWLTGDLILSRGQSGSMEYPAELNNYKMVFGLAYSALENGYVNIGLSYHLTFKFLLSF